jgi:hypothetical protein
VSTYGSYNVSSSYRVQRNNILVELGAEEKINLPTNYRAVTKSHPKFDYKSEFYKDDGGLIDS